MTYITLCVHRFALYPKYYDFDINVSLKWVYMILYIHYVAIFCVYMCRPCPATTLMTPNDMMSMDFKPQLLVDHTLILISELDD